MAPSGVIDLTIDDDDDDQNPVLAPFALRLNSTIAPATNASNRPGPTHSFPTPSQPQARSFSQSQLSFSPLQSSKSPVLNGSGDGGGAAGHDRPIKRRKFDTPAGSGNGNSNSNGNGNGTSEEGRAEAKARGVPAANVNTDALMNCLRLQVIPHLDKAVARLPQGVYDTADLGTSIIGQVADKDFEHHFRLGNGRLAPDVEARVASRIQNLVRDHLKNPKYRLPSAPIHNTQNLRSNGPVIPSIENGDRTRRGNLNAALRGDLAAGFKGEYMDVDPDDKFDDGYEEPESELPATPTPPPLPKKKPPPITPQRLRTRAKAPQWQSGRAIESRKEGTPSTGRNPWFGLSSRPYLKASDRQRLLAGTKNTSKVIRRGAGELDGPATLHVDFSEDEVRYLGYLARALYGRNAVRARDYLRDLRHLLKKDRDRTIRTGMIEAVKKSFEGYREPPTSLRTRSEADVSNYLDDLFVRKISNQPRLLRIERDDGDGRGDVSRTNVVPSVLLAREIGGNHPLSTRRYQNFTTALKTNWEDALEPRIEWTGCAGDITTISWVSNTHFICGTTTHSDSHNQQYNKPGNLLLGSVASKTLRAYPDHRIVRPIVTHGDNALESMVESQDPWLFTSVVSSDYEARKNLAFTSSFDNTVKVWKLDGDTMSVAGTWGHEGRVNFVVASKHPIGMIATAADVPTDAVRVYQVNGPDISSSYYDSYSCNRVHDEDYVPSEKWAYFPAAIRWGIAPKTTHLLLIGYSPRSTFGEDHEIPEDKRNTGELCLWDTFLRTQVKVNSAATQNVFEVVWHPERECFAAATTASGLELEGNINTQIRIFEMNESRAYHAIKTLDCSAVDINEISLRPNSTLYSYITASCTDGNAYVWDTSRDNDMPMCILEHGNPVEELLGEREQEDVGVKFTAWGTTADRLYTGSSDGVVKVWNIRHGRAVLVKDLVEASGPIITGAFSPDFTKLVVGDGTGRVYVMTLDDDDSKEGPQNQLQNNKTSMASLSSGFLQSSAFLRLQVGGKQQAIRRPRPFIPHPEVPPPSSGGDGDGDGGEASSEDQPLLVGHRKAAEFLQNGELFIHPDESIGAVQGPRYANTGLFRAEAHLNGDPNAPLLGGFEALQQENTRYPPVRRFPRQGQQVFSATKEEAGKEAGKKGKEEEQEYVRESGKEGDDMAAALAASLRDIYSGSTEEGDDEVAAAVMASLRDTHAHNVALEATFGRLHLDPETRSALEAEGAEMDPEGVEYDFRFEEGFGSCEGESEDEYEREGEEE